MSTQLQANTVKGNGAPAQITATEIDGDKRALDVYARISALEQSIETRSIPMKVIIDKATADVNYFGFALPGTATSAAAWRIQKLTVTGDISTFEWADGNGNLDNVWDARASLSYS